VLADRALVVPVAAALDELAAAVVTATADLGARPRKRFTGHLTLARLHRRATMPEALGPLPTSTSPTSPSSRAASTPTALATRPSRPGRPVRLTGPERIADPGIGHRFEASGAGVAVDRGSAVRVAAMGVP
jgi:hypothetical protein